MSESAYKPAEGYEDQLDQLAHSIRDELRAAGFRPAFDPEPEHAARQIEQARRRRMAGSGRLILSYIVPALTLLAIAIGLRLFMPTF